MSVRKSWASRALIALSIVPTVLIVTVLPASAERMTWTDPRGDLWYDGGRSPGDAGVSRHLTNGDIARVSVRHRRHTVAIRIVFYDLRAGRNTATGADVAPGVSYRTNEGLQRELHVYFRDRGKKFVQFVESRTFQNVACNVTARRNLARDRMHLRIPRRCLSSPRWIQTSVGSTQSDENNVGDYTDDAHSTGPWNPYIGSWTRRLHRAPARLQHC